MYNTPFIIIYILLIGLLVIGIILGVKAIITIDKVEKIVDSVKSKVNTLTGAFTLIDTITDKLAIFTDNIVDNTTSFIGRLLLKKKRKKKEEKYYE